MIPFIQKYIGEIILFVFGFFMIYVISQYYKKQNEFLMRKDGVYRNADGYYYNDHYQKHILKQ